MRTVLVTTLAALLICGAAQGQTTPAPAAGAAPAAPAAAATSATTKPVSAAQQAQRDRMRDCNADARTRSLKGDERKTFMSSCLRRPAPAEAAARTN